MTETEIKEQNEKVRKEKIETYLAELRAVNKKHGFDIQPVLQVTKSGIVPGLEVVETPKESPIVKP